MIEATVLVPTFDHGPTLRHSVGSALDQTVRGIEVFVVGDGVPDSARDIVRELQQDPRVRFFDNPKGESRGELHRHRALAEARGRIVCYLADDDLWMPEHVATMLELLERADFAHTLPLNVAAGASQAGPTATVDLALEEDRAWLLGGASPVSLSTAGHTLEIYRRLPFGWRTTPRGRFTDWYMWEQILSMPGVRAASGTRPTTLRFGSESRGDWPMERRAEELARWRERIGDPARRNEILLGVLDEVVRNRAAVASESRVLRRRIAATDSSRWMRLGGALRRLLLRRSGS